MKTKLLLSLLALSTSVSAFASGECADMTMTPGILTCLEYRTEVAEKLVDENFNQLTALVAKKANEQVSALRAYQKAWVSLRNSSCGYALSMTVTGEEQGITEVSCALAKTLERVKELEDLVDAEKTGRNTTFRGTIGGLTEARDPTVSAKRIASRNGVKIINAEFNAAHTALMGSVDVKANNLRVKSLRMIDEGREDICNSASIYVAELGYNAQKTQKYIKIYVHSTLNKDRSIKLIKTSVQENIDSEPVCP